MNFIDKSEISFQVFQDTQAIKRTKTNTEIYFTEDELLKIIGN